MEIVLLEASVTRGFALRGIEGELMFYTLQTETFSKSIPQDTEKLSQRSSSKEGFGVT